MKSVRSVLLLLAALGCSPDDDLRVPTAPSPPVPLPNPPVPPTSLSTVWIVVVDDNGVCIDGATATVLRGQGAGQIVDQITPCGVWESGGGIVFMNLTPGVEMTLRVSAPGYVVQERIVRPLLGPQTAIRISPPRVP